MFTKIASHIIYWLLALSFCILIIGYRGDWQEAVFLTIVFSPIPIGSAYIISYHLLEEFLMKQKYFRFFLYVAYILITSFFFISVINTAVFIYVADYKFNMMPPATRDILTLFAILFLLVILFVAVQSIRKWGQANEEKERALKNAAESELRFLKTQLHPHFLFNTLNNLYTLTLEKSEKAPELVLKLSGLLDYVLESGKSKMVDLQSEINVMNNFIYLESLRYEDRLDFTHSIDIPDDFKVQIPPIILITIMENCFKHGAMNNSGQIKISIEISQNQHELIIKSSNTFQLNSGRNSSGIGLKNIRKQLDFIYSENYSLSTKEEGELFLLHLTLPLYAGNKMYYS
ncbi:hypothetical protein GCM10011506_27090 [Marivirga lumbricoides]|uniref:Signal transduction histidine kinase internal region domain-containing protein n=1 Tax=Marivirga lumbricoides TaxID=1046115 RepID=A0ABQ1MG21_9BACT|nr:hypothetical protein GCM10011506_27090 [Marivirga lumbricoides]